MPTSILEEGGIPTFQFNSSDIDFIAKLVKEQDIPHEEEGDTVKIYAASHQNDGPIIDVEWYEIDTSNT